MRGEFVRGDGLVIPNNIMTFGAESLLRWALRAESTYALHMALVNCNPDVLLNANSLGEPTIGVNGYARQPIARNTTDWPTVSQLAGETYVETAAKIFTPSGGDFDQPFSRLALVNSLTGVVGTIVFGLSAPLPTAGVLTPTTPVEQRTFKYRVYLR
jgi:hypothetical protein